MLIGAVSPWSHAFAQQTAVPTTTTTSSASAPNSPSPLTTPPTSDDRRLFLADERNEPAASAPSAAGLLIRTLGALCLIIGLIIAAAWALKRVGGARFGAPREDAPELTVLATVALGDKRSIAAVRFGPHTLLLGSTAQSITLLATQENQPTNSLLNTPPPVRSVADLLRASDEAEDNTDNAESHSARAFDQELTSAEHRFAAVRDAEREEGERA